MRFRVERHGASRRVLPNANDSIAQFPSIYDPVFKTKQNSPSLSEFCEDKGRVERQRGEGYSAIKFVVGCSIAETLCSA